MGIMDSNQELLAVSKNYSEYMGMLGQYLELSIISGNTGSSRNCSSRDNYE